MNTNQLKLELHETCKKVEKKTTIFKPIDDLDVLNKTYLDSILSKVFGQLSLPEKDYDDFKFTIANNL